MSLKTKLNESEQTLVRLIDAFTYIYIVSNFTLASTIKPVEWLHNTANLIALFYLGLLFCYAVLHPKALVSKFALLYLPFLILCGASYFWTCDKARCIKVTLELGAMWVLCSLMFNYLYLEQKTEMLLKAMYVGGICIAVVTVQYYGVEAYIKGVLDGERMGHVIVNMNDLGMRCTYAAMIALYYCIYKKKWLNIFPALFLFAVSYFTLSRKVLVMILAGIVLVIALSGNWKSKIVSVLFGVALVAVVLYVPFFHAGLERINQMVELEDGSTSIRLRMIQVGLEQFKKTPYLGMGLGGSRVLNGRLLDFHGYSHNNYIELMIDLGAVGTILYYFHYLFPIGTFLKQFFTKKKNLSNLMLAFTLISLLLHVGCVEYHERFTIVMVMLFYLVKSDIDRE